MFPAFSRSQGDLKVRGEAYLKVFRFMSFILFPVALGVFLIAPRMVLVVYGEKWLPSVIFIRILVFYGLLRCLNGLIGPVFASAGRPYVSVRIIVLRLLLLLPLMIILDNMLNSAGVALATTLAMALATIYALVLTTNELKLSLRRVAKHISTPFAATVIMGLGVGAVSTLLPMDTLSLVALVVIGAGLYFGSLYILSPQQVLGEVKEAVGVLFPDFAWGRRKI
jgi:PST family polysaccharide transporter